ncbi:FAD/NAD(P)-binding domain-containing protein [Astrocystis sublimbata]|nr:FAD/NAD(P)-binding domain-containing protein [Astrocystis sublimbata]
MLRALRPVKMVSNTFNAAIAAYQYRVLVAGGCYGGLSAAINLLEKCDALDSPISVDVTIVDERDGYYHLIGSPLAMASKEYAEKAWVEYKNVKRLQRPNVSFVQGSVTNVDCENKVATISDRKTQKTREESYDFLVAATGLRRAWPVVPQALTREAYLEEVGAHADRVLNSTAPVLVVGGGAVGIEMATELKYLQPNVQVTLAHSRDKLLSAEPLPDKVKECALELVEEGGVEVLLNHRLAGSVPTKNADGSVVHEVEFTNGHKMVVSEVITAVSNSIPSTSYLPGDALDADGYVNVRPTMQLPTGVPNADLHFAIGDIIHWSGIKRCGGALHQGKMAGVNIHQIMLQQLREKEPDFMQMSEVPPMIGLAVGKNGLSYGSDEMSYGPQVMKLFFEEDLGFRIVWDHLRLGSIGA